MASSTSASTGGLVTNQHTGFLAPPVFLRSRRIRREDMLAIGTTRRFEQMITDSSSDEAPVVDELKSLRYALNLPLTSQLTPSTHCPLVVGHRGSLYDELENTREGFSCCAELGADAVELDVFLLKCGTLAVFHGGGTDEHPGLLQDYCSVSGSILDYTYEQAVSELTFNPLYSEFPCDAETIERGRIPTLREVLLDAKRSGIIIKIELKGPNTAVPTLNLVESLDMVNQCQYSSFDLEQIRTIRQLRPQRDAMTGHHIYKTGALFNNIGDDQTQFIQQALSVGASEVHLRYDECTVGRVCAIHAAKLSSMAWFRGPIGMNVDSTTKYWDVGNETPDMYECVMRTGVEQLCVNRPDVLVSLLRSQQEEEKNTCSKDDPSAIVSEEEADEVSEC